MRPPRSRQARRFALATALGAATLLAGCATTREQLLAQPGLKDVRPIGAKGQKCYDFCSQAEVSCRHMCPRHSFVGDCEEDCEIDTKGCLADCPEMWRPEPPPKK